ncbi:MAG: AmmeMemoRadiSam system protein A [Chromatiales bacterium]|nr:MAG: AmmeMemoRadiSam system protein A [Chromatiales bacterium]
MELAAHECKALLRIARASIQHGLASDRPLELEVAQLAGRLGERRASFVSVYHRTELRGCVGNLQASLPLANDVARNAYHAASQDRRFQPLTATELSSSSIEVAVLSAPQPIEFESEADLHRRLVPHEDGVILAGENSRATFLPKVWEKLPQPADFIRELKRKAGLPADYWSDSLRFARYRATSFSDA